jgi:threonine/homoserine/homoserine lactone efflux protein
MILTLFLKGIAIGVAIAAPVGPVAVLCIRRTLLLGPAAGFASGAGAVLADAIFGAVAAFGVAAVYDLLILYERELRLVGGAFMLVLGVITARRSLPKAGSTVHGSLTSAFFTSFALMMTNPITIFAFVGIFAGFGIVSQTLAVSDSLTLLGGIAVGATLWWAGLTGIATAYRKRVGLEDLGWLNKVSGGLLIFFGVVSLLSLFFVD